MAEFDARQTKLDGMSTQEQASIYLAQGKRHIFVRDYEEAVVTLSMACKLFGELYGETGDECGEAYFNYGKALLELARLESGVLGEGIQEDEQNKEDSDEEENEDDETKESVDEKSENGKTEEEAKSVKDNKEEKTENGKSKEEPNSNNEVEPNSNNEVEPNSNTEGNEAEIVDENGEEDLSNLQLAWEMLELAKVIYERRAKQNKEVNPKLAEVYLKLGEVGLESENYEQAVNDINTCLKIQNEFLQDDDRCLAETHYQLGVAYSLNNEFDNAINTFACASKLIQNRIKNLTENSLKTDNTENSNNPFYNTEEEVKELKLLLPEIEEKINDMKDFKNESMKFVMDQFNPGTKEENGCVQPSTSAGSSNSKEKENSSIRENESQTKEVTNITHLLRRKRKSDDEVTDVSNQNNKVPHKS